MKGDQSIYPPPPQTHSNEIANRLLVLSDLAAFKRELISDIRGLLREFSAQPSKRWLKTSEVGKMLGMSSGTLQTLRNNGTIPYTKIGGVVYYDIEEINKMLSHKKK